MSFNDQTKLLCKAVAELLRAIADGFDPPVRYRTELFVPAPGEPVPPQPDANLWWPGKDEGKPRPEITWWGKKPE